MSIITTFDYQCRALTSAQSPDENASRFLVGTLSPSQENYIYLCEYKDDNNSLAKVSFKFPFGESWHLSASNKYPSLVSGVVAQQGKSKISLFKLPQELENAIEDDYGLSESPIEKIFDLVTDDKNLTRQSHWHPDDGDQVMVCNDGCIEFWDVNEERKVQHFSLVKAFEKSIDYNEPDNKPILVTDLRWSSLFNCSVVGIALGSKIYGIDTRIPDYSSSSICWLIEDQKCNRIQSIDFNPNSQYYLASGGDDCRANFWDLRRTSFPALHLQTHTHWIWSVRYNPFHDRLVLSAGSDARVALMRAQSIASEPFGQMADYEEDDDNDNNILGDNLEITPDAEDSKESAKTLTQENVKESSSCGVVDEKDASDNLNDNRKESRNSDQLQQHPKDEIINVYEEHDDSVYAAEWASDPWIFASLGFESRLVINRVPKVEKFNILF